MSLLCLNYASLYICQHYAILPLLCQHNQCKPCSINTFTVSHLYCKQQFPVLIVVWSCKTKCLHNYFIGSNLPGVSNSSNEMNNRTSDYFVSRCSAWTYILTVTANSQQGTEGVTRDHMHGM